MKSSVMFTAIMALGLCTYGAGSSAQRTTTEVEVDVEVHTDTEYCATGAVQCSLVGHTYEPVTSANHNPVHLNVLVSHNGRGITGLRRNNFFLNGGTVPAGGRGGLLCNADRCTEDHFGDTRYGTYQLFIDHHSSPSRTNWKAGTYVSRLVVTFRRGRTRYRGVALVAFKIPEG